MGNFKGNKATFTEVSKGVYQAVNKRGGHVVRRLGKPTKRSKVSISELRATKGKGTYKLYKYVAVDGNKYGKLVAIR